LIIVAERNVINMPFYDLKCNSCETESNIKATMAEKTENLILCPKCGSTDMETVFKSAPAYIKNSGGNVQACPGATSCGNSGCRFAG